MALDDKEIALKCKYIHGAHYKYNENKIIMKFVVYCQNDADSNEKYQI